MTKLKRCPFCGGEASTYHGDSTDGYIKGTDYVLAFCGWCGASIREKKEEEVIKKWNSRPNPWHTDTPTEEGDYIVLIDGKHFLWEVDDLETWNFEPVTAWQKIEPYKEKEDGKE